MFVYHCSLRNPNKLRHPASRHQHVQHAITVAADIIEAVDRFSAAYQAAGLIPYDVGIWMGTADIVYDTGDGIAIC